MAVIPFRPRVRRPTTEPQRRATLPRPLITDVAEFEASPRTDNYRHRMIVNALAFVVTVLLVLAGTWLATTMAALRNRQDCALMGRHDCSPIEVQASER